MKTMQTTVEVTERNFALVATKGTVLLDFWASWCGPCRALAPVFEAAAARHPDVVFGKVDTDAQPELAELFQIRAVPTLAALRDGVLILIQPGLVSAATLDQLVQRVQAPDSVAVDKAIAESRTEAGVAPSPQEQL